MAKKQSTILRNKKIREEYIEILSQGFLKRPAIEELLSKKYGNKPSSIRQMVSKTNY